MIWRFLLLSLLIAVPILGQSIDEEEAVNVGGRLAEGSGNGVIEDDEDLGGSGLPPDQLYATTPTIKHPKFTTQSQTVSTTTVKKSPSSVVTQRPKVYPTTEVSRASTVAIESGKLSPWNNNYVIIILVGLIVALLVLICAVLICKSCNNKKRTYRTDVKEQSASGLLQKTDY